MRQGRILGSIAGHPISTSTAILDGGETWRRPSEDPLVNARYGVAYTRGLQEGPDKRYLQAVVTLKHWIAYSLEHYGGADRMDFDAIVSRYDFVDTYLPAFRASVVEGKAKGIMCSYNSVNGVPTCANEELTGMLRRDLQFDGYITSDSGAIEAIYKNHHYTSTLCEAGRLAILRGTDINSGSVYRKCLEELVATKQLDETVIDAAVRRTLALRFKLGLFDPIADQPYWHVKPEEVNKPEHQALSLDLTRKSIVLLQNHHATLPLKKGLKIAVIGPHTNAREGMMGNYYGQICKGDYKELGCVETPLEAIKRLNEGGTTTGEEGCKISGAATEGFDRAITLASHADAVVMMLGIDTSIEREPLDRVDIELPAVQLQLLKRIRSVGKPVVVVLFNGGVIGVEEIILYADSVVEAFYPGFYGGQAIAEILFGDTNPSGKLPVTMYRSNFVDAVQMKSMSMTEYPGRSYRYFKEMPVFPFGWGLSYTKFKFSKLGQASLLSTPTVSASLQWTFQVSVANVGVRAGDEVVLAFFRPLSTNASGPATLLNQQLFEYQRVHLQPGTSTSIAINVTDATLALYDDAGHLTSFPGFYEVVVTNGVSERLAFVVHLIGTQRVLRPFPTSSSSSSSSSPSVAPMITDDSNLLAAVE
ncbi:hypothetical protein PINS_up017780 [Pythium insidiosum]|nr:hypothetical protein PINS_up017780 [Pythium insidiosum]